MAWHRKAQGAGISIWFALFYSLLTAGVALALVFMPKSLVESSVQPIPVDQAVQAQQIKSGLWMTNEYTGRTNPFEYRDNLDGVDKISTPKLMTYKVTLGKKSATYDEPLYKRAQPIARFSYVVYVESRKVSAGGSVQDLNIEELYPKKYELKK
jgi:hypothetical protein